MSRFYFFHRATPPDGDTWRTWRRECRDIAALAAPIALSTLAGLAIGTTDIVMMGWLGPDQLAAGALAGEFYGLFYFFGLGVVTATAPMIAHALGARRFRDVRRAVRQGMWVSVAISIPAGFAIWHAGTILPLIGQDPATSALGEMYIRAAVWGFAPSMGLVVLRNFVAAHDRPRSALVITILGIGVNGFFDYALIFGHFGFPRLELVGAGISSAVVNGFMFAALLGYAVWDRRFRRYRIVARLWRADWPRFAEVFSIGTPIGLMNLGEMGTFIAATFLMGLIGTTELAAHAIALQCAGIAYSIPLSLSQAATIRVARAAGAGDIEGVRRTSGAVIALGACWGVVGCLLIWWSAAFVAGMFLDAANAANVPVLDTATAFLVVIAVYQLADGPQAGAIGVLRGLRDTRTPMVIALVSYWVVGATVCVLLGFVLGYGGVGIWAGLAFALMVVAVSILVRLDRHGGRFAARLAST